MKQYIRKCLSCCAYIYLHAYMYMDIYFAKYVHVRLLQVCKFLLCELLNIYLYRLLACQYSSK